MDGELRCEIRWIADHRKRLRKVKTRTLHKNREEIAASRPCQAVKGLPPTGHPPLDFMPVKGALLESIRKCERVLVKK